jgi:hypothetical protein
VYRSFQFHERSQYFVGKHNETLSIAEIAPESPMIGG